VGVGVSPTAATDVTIFDCGVAVGEGGMLVEVKVGIGVSERTGVMVGRDVGLGVELGVGVYVAVAGRGV
jgi:hypothetical protein